MNKIIYFSLGVISVLMIGAASVPFNELPYDIQKRMDLRDQFAGQAMQGMLARGGTFVEVDKEGSLIAMKSYLMADAMMEQRKK